METDKLAKLVDAVIASALAMGMHPDAVMRNLAPVIPDAEARKMFIADIRAELVKIAHTLPWSF